MAAVFWDMALDPDPGPDRFRCELVEHHVELTCLNRQQDNQFGFLFYNKLLTQMSLLSFYRGKLRCNVNKNFLFTAGAPEIYHKIYSHKIANFSCFLVFSDFILFLSLFKFILFK